MINKQAQRDNRVATNMGGMLTDKDREDGRVVSQTTEPSGK